MFGLLLHPLGTTTVLGIATFLHKIAIMGNKNRGELSYLTDGTGLMVFGEEQDLATFDEGFNGSVAKLSPQVLFRANNSLAALAEVQANSGRWVKLDAESADFLKSRNIKHPVSGIVRKGEVGEAGNPGEFMKLLGFEKAGVSPALATGAAGLAAQAAIEAAVDEILEYLEVIDEKLDTLLRQRKIEALSALNGHQSSLEEAETKYRESSSVSQTTWTMIQHIPGELKVTQALAVEQLADAAQQLSNTKDSKKSATLLKALAEDLPFWLRILARSIYLQDRAYVLELAHVDEFEPEKLDAHLKGIVSARAARIATTTEQLLAMNSAVLESATLSNLVWFSNPSRARQITSRANTIREEVAHFARHVQTDLEAGNALEMRSWTDSVRSLASETAQAANRAREQMLTFTEDLKHTRASRILAANESTSERLRNYSWEHPTDPQLSNDAAIEFTEAGMRATGIQIGNGYRAQWELDATENWVTRTVNVNVEGDGWSRKLEFTRDDAGRWSAETSTSGTQPSDLAEPGIKQGTELGDALDCDLGLCPVTNTMPIRRLGLLDGQVPDTPLIMAWIDMPSLQVIASDQYYGSIDEETVHYRSGTRGVDVELEVDSDGVVIAYPDMARRT